jgi:pimeloyl-ACP methyl ester carboxylesterase
MHVTTFLLVPGAGGRAWDWHRLVAEQQRRGHQAVAVDLPAADDSAGIAAYAEAVIAAAAGLGPVVLVAHSLGGFTAPLVCDRVPVELLVLVNAMVPLPGETGGDWWTATGQTAAAEAQAEAAGLPHDQNDLGVVFFHDVPEDVAAAAMAEPFEQSARPFADPWPLPRWPDVPTRVVASREDRLFPLRFQRRVAAERLGVEVDELPGGHFVALARPVELADRLEGYVRELAPGRGR